jgi:CDP-diglyceride synthetase
MKNAPFKAVIVYIAIVFLHHLFYPLLILPLIILGMWNLHTHTSLSWRLSGLYSGLILSVGSTVLMYVQSILASEDLSELLGAYLGTLLVITAYMLVGLVIGFITEIIAGRRNSQRA